MTIPSQPQITPISIFQHAETFFDSLDYLHTAPPERIAPMAASVMVLSAFAAELYFKCLLCIIDGKPPKGHHLHDLYSRLTAEHKHALHLNWGYIIRDREEFLLNVESQGNAKIPRRLADALIEGNKAFEQLRYIYEGPPSFRFFLGDLPLALRRTILDAEPSWSQQDQNFVGRVSSPPDLPGPYQEGSLTFWIRDLDDAWDSNDRIYAFPPLRQNGISVDIFKNVANELSFTVSGPLGRVFIFRTQTPKPCGIELFISITWSAIAVILYLNGQQISLTDPTQTK